MFKQLYIIGNGFDLHHGINSSYRDFQEWMYENNPDVIEEIEEVYEICNDEWWSDFENQLASLDIIEYSSRIASENQPDLLSEHCDRTWGDAQFEVEHQLRSLYNDIRVCLPNWISQLNPPLESKKIDLTTKDAVFINFNYTKTLENLYGISPHKILHIHGCIDEDEDFILGHGKSIDELNLIKTNYLETSSFYTEQENFLELHEQFAIDATIDQLASQRKPVEEIIKKHNKFFNSLTEITNIFVYGLSMSEVDMPYLKHILSKVKSAKWEFSDYKGHNKERITKFCKDNNITNYNIISLSDIVNPRQLKIPFSDL